jgi:hypothetical protein
MAKFSKQIQQKNYITQQIQRRHRPTSSRTITSKETVVEKNWLEKISHQINPIFDTIPDLGSTKLRATFLYPFLHLRERFDTLEVVVIFSSFWAGKSPRHAKIGCVVVHHCHGVSRHNKTKNAKGRDPNMMNGREMVFRASGTRNFGRETKF